jgi:uncharacterized protein YuzE
MSAVNSSIWSIDPDSPIATSISNNAQLAAHHRNYRIQPVMKVIYDADKDILQITLVETTVEETAQIAPGLVIDYDGDGNLIGLEIANASTKVDNPYAISYRVGEANVDKPLLKHHAALLDASMK